MKKAKPLPHRNRGKSARSNAKRNLGLGLGAHFCMGAPLARMEMRVLLEELSKRLPGLRLAEGQEWKFIPTLTFRGIQQLHVEWGGGR